MPTMPRWSQVDFDLERRIADSLLAERRAADEKRAQEGPTRLRMGEIGDCPRNIWARLHGVPDEKPPDAHLLEVFAMGNMVEARVIDLLRLAGCDVVDRDPETGDQLSVSDFEGRFFGYIDGLVTVQDGLFSEEMVLEIKSAKASKFNELLGSSYEKWNPRYGDTLQMYMGYQEVPRALAVVYCKGHDSEERGRFLYCERIDFDRSRFEALCAKAESILSAESLPARPEAATSQYCKFCKWCPRSEYCWSPVREYEAALPTFDADARRRLFAFAADQLDNAGFDKKLAYEVIHAVIESAPFEIDSIHKIPLDMETEVSNRVAAHVATMFRDRTLGTSETTHAD